MPLIPLPGHYRKRSEFYRQLSQLLTNGVPPARSFRTLGSSGGKSFDTPSLEQKAAAIERGNTFSEALFVGRFPSREPLDATLVEVGEQSGRSVQILTFLDQYYSSIARIYQNAIGQCTYPALTYHAAVLVIALVNWILNDFDTRGSVLIILGTLLPLYILVFGSLFLASNRLFAPLRLALETVTSWIPILGKALRFLFITRFTLALDSLLTAGAKVDKSLRLAGSASGSLRLHTRIQHQLPRLEAGLSVSQILKNASFFPESYLVSLSVAEESGSIDQTLQTLYTQYLEDTQRLLSQFGTAVSRTFYVLISIFIIFQIFRVATLYMATFNSILS